MSDDNENLNPYHKLFGIPLDESTPNYYSLLGVSIFESDTNIIANAQEGRLVLLRTLMQHSKQAGVYAQFIPQLLDEVIQAGNCLLNPQNKTQYDKTLKQKDQKSEEEISISPASFSESINNEQSMDNSENVSSQVNSEEVNQALEEEPKLNFETEDDWSESFPILPNSTDLNTAEDNSTTPSGLIDENSITPIPESTPISISNDFDSNDFDSDDFDFDQNTEDQSTTTDPQIEIWHPSDLYNWHKILQLSPAILFCISSVLTFLLLLIIFFCFSLLQPSPEQKKAEKHFNMAQELYQKNEMMKAFAELQMADMLNPSQEYLALKEEIIHKFKPGEKMTKTVEDIQYDFCWCPPGTFMMGSPKSEPGHKDNETQHKVTLTEGFWMLDSEVTVGMFRSFVQSTGYQCHGEKPMGKVEYSWENPGFKQTDEHPVVCVSWFDAVAFCKWLGEQLDMDCYLPTEAQWEYACRAGTTSMIGGTGDINEMAWTQCGGTRPVKGKKPNDWGLFDMHGNAGDWCADWYDTNYFEISPENNPTGPEGSHSRVLRGGGWSHSLTSCKSSFRHEARPRFRHDSWGFRVRLTPNKPNPKQIITALMTENQKWSYTFVNPGNNWTNQFPLPKSKNGAADFDTSHLWEKDKQNIWLTTELILPDSYKPEPLVIQYRVDDDIQIYVNDIRLIRRTYKNGDWRLALPTRNPLHGGKNIIAVKCENYYSDGPGMAGVELYQGGIFPHVDLSDKTDQKHYFLVGEHDALRCVETKSFVYDSITLEGDSKSNINGPQGERVMSITADGKRMCRADKDHVVRLWDVQTGEIIRDFGAASGSTAQITMDGTKIVSGIEDQVYIWNPETGTKTDFWELPGKTGDCWCNMALSLDGKQVAFTYRKDKNNPRFTGIWNIESKKQIQEIPGHEKICFSPDGTKIGSTGGVWDLASGERLYENKDSNYAFTWSPLGDVVAFGTHGSEVCIRDANTGRLKKRLHGPRSYIWSLSFSTDGKYLAATAWFSTYVWNTKTWEKVDEFDWNRNFGRVAFIPQRDYPQQLEQFLKQLPSNTENIQDSTIVKDLPDKNNQGKVQLNRVPPTKQVAKIAETDQTKKATSVSQKNSLSTVQLSETKSVFSRRQVGERLVKTINGVQFAFRWCPPGSFIMGSPENETGHLPHENQHKVTLTKGFWLMETEVTQAQWKAVMGDNPSVFKGDNLPVEYVNWTDCQAFCQKSTSLGLPLKLPTEAQWEYACRAGTTGAFAGDLDAIAWYLSNSYAQTHPVATKKPNAWGLYDMHGNVWEWCADWVAEYPNGAVIDPAGPSQGTVRVGRGGGWFSIDLLCRSATRCTGEQERAFYLGLRCVLIPTSADLIKDNRPDAILLNADTLITNAPVNEDIIPEQVNQYCKKLINKQEYLFGQVFFDDNGKKTPATENQYSVAIPGCNCRTFDNGWYVIPLRSNKAAVPKQTLYASALYYNQLEIQLDLNENEGKRKDIILKKTPDLEKTTIQGVILDEQNNPVKDIEISIRNCLDPWNGFKIDAKTDEKGYFSFPPLTVQSYQVFIMHEYYKPQWFRLDPVKDKKQCYQYGNVVQQKPSDPMNLMLYWNNRIVIDYEFSSTNNFSGTKIERDFMVHGNTEIDFKNQQLTSTGDIRLLHFPDTVFGVSHSNGKNGFYDAGEVPFDSVKSIDKSKIEVSQVKVLLNHVYCVYTTNDTCIKFMVKKIEKNKPEE